MLQCYIHIVHCGAEIMCMAATLAAGMRIPTHLCSLSQTHNSAYWYLRWCCVSKLVRPMAIRNTILNSRVLDCVSMLHLGRGADQV